MPDENLCMKYVHGYRSFDSRNNLKWLKDERVIYYTAAIGIVLDPKTNEQNYFTRHSEDIVSLAINATGSIAATGQISQFAYEKTAVIYVWCTTSMKTLSVLKGFHKKAVRHVIFECYELVDVLS